MPFLSEESFTGLPPFPDDVPTAPLLRLSLSKLLAHDAEEEDRLWKACCDLGFFYLDLRSAHQDVENGHANGSNGHSNGDSNGHANGSNGESDEVPIDGESMLREADQLFEVQKEFFQLPAEEKQKYDFADQNTYFGYKGIGSGVIDKQGTKDRNEFYNISKDSLLSVTPALPAPAMLDKHSPLLTHYSQQAHAVQALVLTLVAKRLGLAPSQLHAMHALQRASGDHVRFVRAPPQPAADRRTALGAHSDFGSVTVLMNRLGGLQVRLPAGVAARGGAAAPLCEVEPSGERWAYVRPLPGHAVVNLGDAMVIFSQGLLRSNVHRVVSPPGAQADVERYSLVYFGRPADDVVLRPLRESAIVAARCKGEEKGDEVSAKEWILRRALYRRNGARWEDSKGTEDVRS